MADNPAGEPAGGDRTAVTVRLELDDEPGALRAALDPIAAHEGNLLSIHHERGNRTPRGAVPVEIDFECRPDRFEAIVDALRQADVTVTRAGTERYVERRTVVLVGDLLAASLSTLLTEVDSNAYASVVEFRAAGPDGLDDESSARLTLAVADGRVAATLTTVRRVAAEQGLDVIEPLSGGTD